MKKDVHNQAGPYENLETPYTTLEKNHLALLVIDTQNDFGTPGGSHPMPDIETVIPEIITTIKMFRCAGKPIIHMVRLYQTNGNNVDMCRRRQVQNKQLQIVTPGSTGAEPVKNTCPENTKLDCPLLLSGSVQTVNPREFIIYKPRFNSFHQTPLDSLLKIKGITSVILIGMTFPNCIRATQLGASDHNYRVGLIPSACTQTYPHGLKTMLDQGVQLMTVNDLKNLLVK